MLYHLECFLLFLSLVALKEMPKMAPVIREVRIPLGGGDAESE